MALGIAAIPFGMIVDWRLATKSARQPPTSDGSRTGRLAAKAAATAPQSAAAQTRAVEAKAIGSKRWDDGSASPY